MIGLNNLLPVCYAFPQPQLNLIRLSGIKLDEGIDFINHFIDFGEVKGSDYGAAKEKELLIFVIGDAAPHLKIIEAKLFRILFVGGSERSPHEGDVSSHPQLYTQHSRTHIQGLR
jgi:hypothetical protein